MPVYHLAQMNIARVRAPMEDPIMDGFRTQLDPVNALADRAPGFVWRLQTESGNATSIHAWEDPRILLNMSVWTSIEALRAFAYGNRAHLAVMRRRREWFERLDTYLVLWWVPAGHLPTVAEAEERLETLRALGPSPEAFTFRQPFPPVSRVADPAA